MLSLLFDCYMLVLFGCYSIYETRDRHKKIALAAIKSRKFYQKRNNNKKVDSIETGRTIVACLLP